ncbi:MAG: CNNM domain-containing protein [Pseudomonadota bacterium]|nr:CNNM domain-containing protein [Pseudomonadota bacterium]
MDLPLHILIGSIVGLVILSAFFSGSETSLTSASKPRMHNLAKSGKKNAKIFETLFKDKELLICTILFANNLVNVFASALATKILIELTNTDGIFYATIIMTLMILIFGELIPKTLALSKSDTYALKISPFIRFLVILLYPLTVTLNFIVYVLLKIVGVNYSNFKKEEISEKREEELRGAIDLHGEDSSRDEKNMLNSILDLDEITVGSIMIPRKDIFSLPANINFNDLIEKLDESPHSRIPIWEKNPENIIGVFHVRRLISLKNPDPKKFNIKLLCQKPWFIPESTKLDNQLMEFKKRKEHFSIVVDEYGEFLGIVTLEDIIEEIVGDIDDEQDMLKISKKVKGIKSLSPSNFLVKGTVSIRDLNKELNINLPINNNVSTIAGLVLYESRTIPKTKQIFSFFDLKFEILNKTNNQITLLKISKKKD